jgi:hypothetical protein
MGKPICYAITTRKFSLTSGHNGWFAETQKLYNEILRFYYNLYLDTFPEQQPGSQEGLRALEQLTIVGRDKQPVPHPLPWEKVPLYFRRSAINAAIAAARSYLARETQQQRTENFAEAVTFYKGMYREFSENRITLKLWNGESWAWLACRLGNNTFPKEGESLSPSVVLKGKRLELHVPFKTPVADGRTARERMETSEKLCSVVFTNRDAAVVCCIMDSHGETEQVKFLKGGNAYAGACRSVLSKLQKSKDSMGTGTDPYENKKYWQKLKNLHEHYAHQFSRQVIDYCRLHQAKLLVLPQYEEQHRRYVMLSAGNWSPIHLSTRIREKLKYKAWQEGIVVLELPQHHISDTCSICGAKSRRKGNEYACINGHRGNAYLNMAKNQGRNCLRGFGKQVP